MLFSQYENALLCKVREYLVPDNILLVYHGVLAEVVPGILQIQLHEILELHVTALVLLHNEIPVPLLRLPFGLEPSLGGLPVLAGPVLVSVLDQPLPGFGVFLCGHQALTPSPRP